MEGQGTAQMGHAEEKIEEIVTPVEFVVALARVIKMLEKIDSRVGVIEA